MKRFKNLLFFVFVWIVGTIFLCCTIEFGARLLLKANTTSLPLAQHPAYKGYDWSAALERDVAPFEQRTFNSKQYVPFSLWKETPFNSSLFNVNEEGYRKTVLAEPADTKERTRIFFFGGSTLFNRQVPDTDTIPSLVARSLSEQNPDRFFDVRNYGIDGFLSTQEVQHLLSLLRAGDVPDIVVFYDGINDIYNRIYANREHTFMDRFDTVLNRRAAIQEFSVAMLRKLAVTQLLQEEPSVLKISEEELHLRAARFCAQYRVQANNIVGALAKEFGFSAYFVWQSNLFTSKKKLSSFEQEILAAQDTELERVFRNTQPAISAMLSAIPNAIDCRNCYDAISRTIFVDPYHVTTAGNEVVAKRIDERLSATIP